MGSVFSRRLASRREQVIKVLSERHQTTSRVALKGRECESAREADQAPPRERGEKGPQLTAYHMQRSPSRRSAVVRSGTECPSHGQGLAKQTDV